MKNLNSTVLALVSACAALVSSAAPTITSGPTLAAGAKGSVVVSYTLGEAAIVTARLKLGGAYADMSVCNESILGDVNMSLAAGAHKFTWYPLGNVAEQDFAAEVVQVELKVWPTSAPPNYRVHDLSKASSAVRYYENADDLPGEGGVTNDLYKTAKMVFRYIDAAGKSFYQGSPTDEEGRGSDEDLHKVNLTKDFWLGVFPVTERQYQNASAKVAVADFANLPAADLRPRAILALYQLGQWGIFKNFPLTYDGSLPMDYIRQQTGITDLNVPTEAQWEFACRAGTETARYADDVDRIAWYSCDAPQPVGLKEPNAWGLYDMLGNVDETTYDYYKTNLGSGEVTDPLVLNSDKASLAQENPKYYVGNANGMYDIVFKGGSWNDSADCCRAAYRFHASYSGAKTWTGARFLIPVSTVRGETEPTFYSVKLADPFSTVCRASDDETLSTFCSFCQSILESEAIDFDNEPKGGIIILR